MPAVYKMGEKCRVQNGRKIRRCTSLPELKKEKNKNKYKTKTTFAQILKSVVVKIPEQKEITSQID